MQYYFTFYAEMNLTKASTSTENIVNFIKLKDGSESNRLFYMFMTII